MHLLYVGTYIKIIFSLISHYVFDVWSGSNYLQTWGYTKTLFKTFHFELILDLQHCQSSTEISLLVLTLLSLMLYLSRLQYDYQQGIPKNERKNNVPDLEFFFTIFLRGN